MLFVRAFLVEYWSNFTPLLQLAFYLFWFFLTTRFSSICVRRCGTLSIWSSVLSRW